MPPYPGIPYGAAPAWCFPVFEYSMYLLFLFCLAYAIKQGKRDVLYLLGGLTFGLTLEYIEVISGMGYTYGHFMVMFGKAPLDIPLCIGIGWGIIMYTARLFSDSLRLGLWACAALDTLLAINIDVSMDTVAYRLHMWHWNWSGTNLNPLTANWFGVPWGNFLGWLTVVFCYSAFSRLFEKRIIRNGSDPLFKFIFVAILALLCSELVLYITEIYIDGLLYKYLKITTLGRIIGTVILFVIMVMFGWGKRGGITKKIPAVAWWVPGWFHFYFFVCLFLLGFYTENIKMTVIACINVFIGIILHIYPLLFKFKQSEK